MSFGHFDDDAREYVITRPDTPLPWINYLGSEDYFGIISNTAGGYSFYRDARLRRLTRYRYNNVPLDIGGRYLYLRDDGERRVLVAVVAADAHATSTATPAGTAWATRSSVRVTRASRPRRCYFVPLGETLEVWRTRITNQRDEPGQPLALQRRSSSACGTPATTRRTSSATSRIGEVEVEDGVIYHKTEYRERRDHFAYFACSEPLAGLRHAARGVPRPVSGLGPAARGRARAVGELDRARLGAVRLAPRRARRSRPARRARSSSCSATRRTPRDDEVRPARIADDQQAPRARPVIERYLRPGRGRGRRSSGCATTGTELLGTFQVATPDVHTNRMVNIWNAVPVHGHVQPVALGVAASSPASGAGMGFRDSNQDLLGFVHMVPGRARERILDLAATQLPTGGAYHQYQPLTKRGNDAVGSGFNDDPLWLVLAVAAYLKETGDSAILDEPVPYDNEPGSETPLYEHLQRALQLHARPARPARPAADRARRLERLPQPQLLLRDAGRVVPDHREQGGRRRGVGLHRRPVRAGGRGAGGDRRALAVDPDEAAALPRRAAADGTRPSAEHGWDGAWFLRAYDHFGDAGRLGRERGGQIFVEPQGMCVMAGIGLDDGRAAAALASVARAPGHAARASCCCSPPTRATTSSSARSAPTRPGYKENARRLLPHQPVDHDRRDAGRRRRPRLRLLPAHQPVGAREPSASCTAASRTSTRR